MGNLRSRSLSANSISFKSVFWTLKTSTPELKVIYLAQLIGIPLNMEENHCPKAYGISMMYSQISAGLKCPYTGWKFKVQTMQHQSVSFVWDTLIA